MLFLQMIAGAGSGSVTKTATAPLERIKIIFQVQVRSGPRHRRILVRLVRRRVWKVGGVALACMPAVPMRTELLVLRGRHPRRCQLQQALLQHIALGSYLVCRLMLHAL
jgi:hypothetical protein